MKNKILVGAVVLVLLALAFLAPPPADALGMKQVNSAGPAPVNIFDWALGAESDHAGTGEAASTPQLIQSALHAQEIDEDTALRYLTYALSNSAFLPERFRSQAPWEGTLLLIGLENEVKSIPENNLLAQVVQTSLAGVCGGSSAVLANSYDTAHFHFEYGDIRGGLNIQDYALALEKSWEVNVDRYAWAAPPSGPQSPGGSTRLLVRIDALSGGLYGYVTTSGSYAGYVGDNPSTSWKETDAYASCMVLNRDYSGFPSGAKISLQSTAAHEFNHMIQFGMGALSGANPPDMVFVEASATWMEDEVFDQANDNYNYLWPDFRVCMGNYTASPYGYWITLRGMTESFGVGYPGGGEDILQNFWEQISRKEATNMPALDNALRTKGTNLADAFHKYAIAAKFNRPCTGEYNSPFCLKEGPSYVQRRGAPLSNASLTWIGARHQGALADNFSLTWIDLPTGDTSYDVNLTNLDVEGGQFRGSLVCDTGSTLQVTPFSSLAGPWQTAQVASFDASGCVSVVAVITNQAMTGSGKDACTTRSFSLEVSLPTTEQPVDPDLPPPSQQRDSNLVYLPMLRK